MTTPSSWPVVLRGGVVIEDPLSVVLGFLAHWHLDLVSAAQIAAILERRDAIERALGAIAPDALLSAEENSVPWLPLRQLFDAFAGIRGVGFAKMTKGAAS